ncbi:unnamed protein product [Lupinus luteus]|uniref:RING-CH-type domain-containing protein n=1 Tax=Lupinus luteus TaxID=3873 RepID=A0AAV1YE59_LUPLU
MSDHLVLYVDRLVRPIPVEPMSQDPVQPSPEPSVLVDAAAVAGPSDSSLMESDGEGEGEDEEERLLQMAECRICQEEDSVSNLESPCTCRGSLKYAHRKCVQHWCNEKGDITCEICHKPYQPGYTAPPPCPRPEETTIDIGGGWRISGTPLDLHDPRLLAIAEAERQFLEAEYDGYAASNASGAAFFRSAALILMALLLLRHALFVTDADVDAEDDPSTFFSVCDLSSFWLNIWLLLYCFQMHCRANLINSPFSAAFLASSSWFSFALLYHGLGNQYFAASATKTSQFLFLFQLFL